MKIAILSDIHGNAIALDAVLKDIEARGGVEEYWILGDVAALGYDPAGVIERLSALPGASFIRGNTDHYLVSGGFPRPDLAEVQNNPELIEHHLRAARSFAWTEGAVTSHGWREWLECLPVEMRHTLPDGTRVLAAHAARARMMVKGSTRSTRMRRLTCWSKMPKLTWCWSVTRMRPLTEPYLVCA